MFVLNLIVAVDKNWGIGKNNRLLVSIPQDMKFFRETTSGGVVIMGRKTLESLPGGKPLQKRINIVISSDINYVVPGAVVVHGINQAIAEAKKYKNKKVFVIGGASIYRQMLPYCNFAYVRHNSLICRRGNYNCFYSILIISILLAMLFVLI